MPFPAATANYRAVAARRRPRRRGRRADLLLAAQRPLIFLGNGARRALRTGARGRLCQAFVERFAIPVMTTPEAKGIFPESHALSLRNYGLAGCDWTSALPAPPTGGRPAYDACWSSVPRSASSRATTDARPATPPPTSGLVARARARTARSSRSTPTTRDRRAPSPSTSGSSPTPARHSTSCCQAAARYRAGQPAVSARPTSSRSVKAAPPAPPVPRRARPGTVQPGAR